jgi:hypothetical protein
MLSKQIDFCNITKTCFSNEQIIRIYNETFGLERENVLCNNSQANIYKELVEYYYKNRKKIQNNPKYTKINFYLTYLINKPLLLHDKYGDNLLKPLNNEEIDEIMYIYSDTNIFNEKINFKYQGTYPCDFYKRKDGKNILQKLIFNKNKDITAFILNTSNKNETGEHWLSIIINNSKAKKEILFFDSFGRDPEEFKKETRNNLKYILKYLQKELKCDIKINKLKYQDEKSNHCGDYCIYYIMSYINKTSRIPLLKDDDIKIFRTFLWNLGPA